MVYISISVFVFQSFIKIKILIPILLLQGDILLGDETYFILLTFYFKPLYKFAYIISQISINVFIYFIYDFIYDSIYISFNRISCNSNLLYERKIHLEWKVTPKHTSLLALWYVKTQHFLLVCISQIFTAKYFKFISVSPLYILKYVIWFVVTHPYLYIFFSLVLQFREQFYMGKILFQLLTVLNRLLIFKNIRMD